VPTTAPNAKPSLIPQEFVHGWPVISAAVMGIGLGMSPLPFYTIGVFIGPISQEFGWEPSKVLLALSVYTVFIVFMAPFIGMVTDRIGARKVALASIIMFGISMMMQSLHTGSLPLYITLWAFIAIFGAGTLPITFTKAINNRFNIHRGKALGIALVSTGVFGALAKFLAAEIMALYGWRMAYVALGFLPIIIAFPIALVAFHDIDDHTTKESLVIRFKIPILAVSAAGMSALAYYVLSFILPIVSDGGWKLQYLVSVFFLLIAFIPLIMVIIGDTSFRPPLKDNHQQSDGKVVLTGMTMSQALSGWRFWMLSASFVVISVSIGAVIPNLEQILISKGFTMSEAVGLAVLTGLSVLGGRVIGGFLIDKYWAPAVAFIFLSSPAIALYLLSGNVISSEVATISILMIGFGAGVEYDFLAYLVAKYFGMRSYASIYGGLYAFFGIGAGFGPAILSHYAESQGEWVYVLIYAAIALVLGSLPLLMLGKYTDFTSSD
jgi:MFS family permease